MYYEANNEPETKTAGHEYLFSMMRLRQIHCILRHAPVESFYSTLRRAYPLETGAPNLAKLVEVTNQCKGFQLLTK